MKDWTSYFFDGIPWIASKSKDPNTKVGCIITNQDHSIVATGYNGFPRGVYDDTERYEDRDIKLQLVVHAELNAIAYAAKHGVPLDNTTLYIDWVPCQNCMKAIIQAGITKIYINGDSPQFNNKELFQRWRSSIAWSLQMANEADLTLIVRFNGSFIPLTSITTIEGLLK